MSASYKYITNFIRESNKIESIMRQPRKWEIDAFKMFLELEYLEIKDVENLVNAFQPGAKLRIELGMDVSIGGKEKLGHPDVKDKLQQLLYRANDYKTNRRHYRGRFEEAKILGVLPWQVHVDYEYLHPFIDGNGRSGRAIWAWMHGGQSTEFMRGFLHSFYYETLMNS